MLTVTEKAGAHLAQMIAEQNLPDGTAARFVTEGQGIALRQDTEREGDTALKHKDTTVLLLDAQLTELLDKHTLDLDGDQLTLQQPNEGP